MKILTLGLDDKILDPLSGVTKRAYEYGELTERYTVIVPAKEDKRNQISDKTDILGVKGSKLTQLVKIFLLASDRIKKEKFQIISVQDTYYLAILAWILARRFKLGLEIQVHGFEKLRGIRKFLAKFVLPRADAVRTVSKRFEKKLIREFNVAAKKITVVPIYSTVDLKKTHEREKKDHVVFLTVCRFVPIKNIEMQINAAKILLKEGLDIELQLVGDGPEKDKLTAMAKGYEERIKFSGWLTELDEIYSKADIFLLTSNREGWGLVIIEAASFGLPVIMTNVGCAGEIVKDGENGTVVPVGDLDALAAAMKKYYFNYDLRIKHAKALQESINRLPDKGKTLELYKQSWEKAIASRQ